MRTPEQMAVDREAARLRSRGLTYPQIAAEMGCAVSNAYERVQRAIADLPTEDVAEARAIELAKLDDLEQRTRAILESLPQRAVVVGTGPKAELVMVDDPTVNLHATQTMLRIAERRARLAGLDKPIRAEVSGPDGGPIVIEDADRAADVATAYLAGRQAALAEARAAEPR